MIPAAATTRVKITDGAPKPMEPALMSPYINAVSATTASTWPAQSNGAGRRGEGATHLRRINMAMQTGRLMANTSRQSSVVNRPPRSGPTAPATAPPTAQIPSALARRRASGKASRISDIDAGSIVAAASPWTNLAAMRAPVVGANAQAVDASRNKAIPQPRALFAPMRSERLPADSNSAANINVYPSITHCCADVPPPSSWSMLGRATLTIKLSRVIRKNPSDPISRVRLAWGASAVTVPGAGRDVVACGVGTGPLEWRRTGGRDRVATRPSNPGSAAVGVP